MDGQLRQAIRKIYDFKDELVIPASAGSSAWSKTLVQTGGSPAVAPSKDGVTLTIDATAEAQAANLLNGDVLLYGIDDLITVQGMVKLSTDALNAGIDAVFGLAGAYNATLDTIAQNCWFKLPGSNSVVVETDDGTNDNDDKATGLTLKDEWRKFAIDFSSGVLSQGPPATSKGGKASVRFYLENDYGKLMPVCEQTNFDMSNYSGGLQLFAAVRKASGAGAASLMIKNFVVDYRD